MRKRHVLCLQLWIAAMLLAASSWASAADGRPNILWITIEDWSPDLSCYGTPGIQTPFVDRLAAEGRRYELAFTTAPVCSASRSAMMTGYHQNFIGANQHRENNKRPLPAGVRPIPHVLRDAGYFTALMSRKIDCNFTPSGRRDLFEGDDWSDRKPGQPFFARITFAGTHRPWKRDPQRPIDPSDVAIPPCYPDSPLVRRDWANGLEAMQIVDRQVGALLKRLDEEGLSDNTLVFFIADHGQCHIRGKQFLYDAGIRVPLIIRWPGKIRPGEVSQALVSSLDVCATVVEVAGAETPQPLHGKSLLGKSAPNREYVFAARDKMDETHDAMRAIRSRRFKLIQNLMPERPYCQFNRYKEASYPVLAEMNALHMRGELTPEQSAFLARRKPPLELYDLQRDPHELRNLADDPAFADIRAKLFAELQAWRTDVIRDAGVSDTFRAADVFPAQPAGVSVGEWVAAHRGQYDYRQHGWPAWYPTRTLEQWESVRSQWKPYVFREPTAPLRRPRIPGTSKPGR